MIVFSRPPGWRRRAGDVGTSTLRSGSDCPPYNSGRRERVPLLRRTGRQAALEPSGGREKRPFGRPCGFLRSSSRGPCDAPPSRRTTLLAEEPARPSDVSPFYESKYWTGRSRRPPRRQSGGKRQGRGARITSDSGFPPLRPSSTAFAPGRRRARGGAGEGRQFNALRRFACPTGTAASQGFRTASRMASDVPASPRHALLAENLGKPSLGVIIKDLWYQRGIMLTLPGLEASLIE